MSASRTWNRRHVPPRSVTMSQPAQRVESEWMAAMLCRLRLAVGARRENPVYPTMRVGNRFPDREAR